MTAKQNRQWRIMARPEGLPRDSDFRWMTDSVPSLEEGQILVRNIYLSLDPGLRHIIWDGGSILPPVSLGEVMPGFCIGMVEESRHEGFHTADIVYGLLGWQDYSVTDGEGLAVLPKEPRIPLTAAMAVFSLHIGATAYFGLLDVGKPVAGETVVVSSAAGGVGSLVGQIAKIKGCRVVGTAGSDEKCAWITEELGFDAAVNYKSGSILDNLRTACPDGVDVYFDCVGGAVLDAVLRLINMKARIVSCGVVSAYNDTKPTPQLSNFIHLHFVRAKIEGFNCIDYLDRVGEAMADLGKWFAEGRIKYKVDVVDGLENATITFNRLFGGSTMGKLMVKVSEEPRV